MRPSVLIIDDEVSIREVLCASLREEGYEPFAVAGGKEALEWLSRQAVEVVLLDIWMPGEDGLQILERIKKEWPEQSVLMMSGHGTIETAVKATKRGAFDFLEKPLSLERLLVSLRNVLAVKHLERENEVLRTQLPLKPSWVGESPGMKQLREKVQRVAPTRGSVLITGENGTGKELVARQLHALSGRARGPWVELNCAAIPEELIESELFGHEKGAFTGATQLRRGRFDLAHQGTLFLDEIGDMSLKTQAKILRILQEQKFERVGGMQTYGVDVRILAATNKDLKQEIQQGRFREDLYYRLNVVSLHVPPLRERGKEDIILLARTFLEEFSRVYGKKPRLFSPEALHQLVHYAWPGNVRELRNGMERLVILSSGEEEGTVISSAELGEHLLIPEERILTAFEGSEEEVGKTLRVQRRQFEKQWISKVLKEEGGNVSQAAQVLGIERTHLHRKMKELGLESED